MVPGLTCDLSAVEARAFSPFLARKCKSIGRQIARLHRQRQAHSRGRERVDASTPNSLDGHSVVCCIHQVQNASFGIVPQRGRQSRVWRDDIQSIRIPVRQFCFADQAFLQQILDLERDRNRATGSVNDAGIRHICPAVRKCAGGRRKPYGKGETRCPTVRDSCS